MSVFDRILDAVVEWRNERWRKRWAIAHDIAELKANAGTLTDKELIYAAYDRCPCGAGLAYAKNIGPHGFWDCSAILTGKAMPGFEKHTAQLPFVCWEIVSEWQPSANGATTRAA